MSINKSVYTSDFMSWGYCKFLGVQKYTKYTKIYTIWYLLLFFIFNINIYYDYTLTGGGSLVILVVIL